MKVWGSSRGKRGSKGKSKNLPLRLGKSNILIITEWGSWGSWVSENHI